MRFQLRFWRRRKDASVELLPLTIFSSLNRDTSKGQQIMPSSSSSSLSAVKSSASSSALLNGNPQNQSLKSTGSQKSSDIREEFEAKASSAKNGALFVAVLHLLSRFFGICALTWATVVLLGGFAPTLRTLDFFLVSALLLLDGARLFMVQIFSKILSRNLFRESHRPEDFEFKDLQYIKANRLSNFGQAISGMFAFASFIASIVRFVLIRHGHGLGGNGSDKSANLTYALYSFYVLVLGNSFLAIASAVLRPFFRSRCKDDYLMRFHDEVYKTAMAEGVPEADQLDILDFAYTKLSSDYKRNIRPPLIRAQNKDLICYLYHNQQGIAMNCEYMSSSDVWKQVVASNLPGFWAGEPRIESQVALFWALQKRIYGAGKDAESALNSIECLGQKWETLSKGKPYPFLIKDPSSNLCIVDTLVRLLLEPIRPTLLFQLRAFEACCRNTQVLQHIYKYCSPHDAQRICQKLQESVVLIKQEDDIEAQLHELCQKLFTYLSEKGIWITTKIYAGSALLSLLCYGEGEMSNDVRLSLQVLVEEFIGPANPGGDKAKNVDKANNVDKVKKPYFWLNDLTLVEKMRMKLKMGRYAHWPEVRVRNSEGAVLNDAQVLDHIQRLRSSD